MPAYIPGSAHTEAAMDAIWIKVENEGYAAPWVELRADLEAVFDLKEHRHADVLWHLTK